MKEKGIWYLVLGIGYWVLGIGILVTGGCRQKAELEGRIRPLADTVGFAHLAYQMDSVMARIGRSTAQQADIVNEVISMPKVIICPHDDYAYVGKLYPAALKNIRAKTIILFGVAHKAKLLNVENQVVFDSYVCWKGPYGKVKISPLREEIMRSLPDHLYQVNDSLERLEHSVEAIIPFLQYYDRDIEIVSILVPYMPYDRMTEIADALSEAIKNATMNKGLEWGKDFIIVISTDAVHYGDEDWGGKNYAPFGTDSAGYTRAVLHEHEIMDTLSGNLNPHKIKAFCDFTVDEKDFHEYKWTWCGRYSVPMGLQTAYELNREIGNKPLIGSIVGYSNSIDHPSIVVDDLGMGLTAGASLHHWVGYAALSFN